MKSIRIQLLLGLLLILTGLTVLARPTWVSRIWSSANSRRLSSMVRSS